MKKETVILISVFAVSCLLLLIVIISKNFISRTPVAPSSETTQNLDGEKKDRGRIRRVTVYDDDGSCLEIGSDAVVKSYSSCESQLSGIHRFTDPKRVIELIEYVSRIDTLAFKQKPVSGKYLTLSIQTEAGSETVYVPVSHGNDSISDTIDLIKGDLPKATPTPEPTAIPTPTLPGTTPLPTLTPTPTLFISGYPTPSTTQEKKTFTCGFSDTQSTTIPFYVSQVICSTEPSPAPR